MGHKWTQLGPVQLHPHRDAAATASLATHYLVGGVMACSLEILSEIPSLSDMLNTLLQKYGGKFRNHWGRR